ncbi:MAG: MBL fold metallo-hydrolase [Desulfovibrionaceae bacterium]|nr:MBL fold metallo-hydrolase [Desulfovibrionaceae bacterium]
MPIASFSLGPLETNCHIIYNDTDAIVVDPGGDKATGLNDILAFLTEKKLTVQAILCTHLHFDHLYGVSELHELTGAEIYAPQGDSVLWNTEVGSGGAWGFPKVTPFEWTDLSEGDHAFGSIEIKVLSTPGHTPGSLSFYVPSMEGVLTGDLLFYHSVGRTDFPGSSTAALIKSLHKKIFVLPPNTKVYPGHGSNTNVGEELANNPYLWL